MFKVQKMKIVLVLLSVTAFGAAALPQSADEIVAANVAARGGLDAWRAVRTLRMTGQMDVGRGVQVPFTLQLKRPRKMRLEFLFAGEMAELESTLQKILKKETDDRYQSMEEVLLDLEPIYKRLQTDIVGELVIQGQQLIESGDYLKARDVLRQAASLDTAQTQVKHLLEKVNQELKRSKVLPQTGGPGQQSKGSPAIGQGDGSGGGNGIRAEAGLPIPGDNRH